MLVATVLPVAMHGVDAHERHIGMLLRVVAEVKVNHFLHLNK